MPFETDGFFSPEIAQFRHGVRTTPRFRAWFDYALRLNRIGFDLLRHASTQPTDRRLFTMYVTSSVSITRFKVRYSSPSEEWYPTLVYSCGAGRKRNRPLRTIQG